MLQSEAGYIDARPQSDSSTKPLATHGRTIHGVIRVASTVRLRLPISPRQADLFVTRADMGEIRAAGFC
jgi:hypothetical protein